MPNLPDTRLSLIARLADARDHAAWADFVEIYEPAVYGLARKFGLQHVDAQDLAQDVLVSVSKAISSWRPDASRAKFRTWLYTVAKNQALNAIVKQRRTPRVGDTDMGQLIGNLPERSVEDTFDLEYRRNVFLKAASLVSDEVGPKQWQAFWRTSIDGTSVETVVRELEMSVGAIYTAKSRILAKIRAHVVRLMDEAETE